MLQAAAALLAVDGHLPAYRGQGEIMPSDAVLLTRDLALDLGRVGSCRCRWPLASPAPGHPATRIPSRPGEIASYLHPILRDAAPALSRLDLDPTRTPVQLAGLAARLADAADRWRPILRHDPDRRWYGRLRRLDPPEAAAVVAGGGLLVDIRPAAQRQEEGEVPGALVVERKVLEWRLDPTSPHRLAQVRGHDQPVVILCSEGYTSSLAAAALQELGLHRATDVVGGYHAWARAGLPVHRPGRHR